MQLDLRLLSLLKSRYLSLSLPITAGFLGGLLVVFQARILSSIISSVYLYQERLSDLYNWFVILLILIFLRGILIWLGDYTASRFAIRIKTDLRTQLYDHILQLGPNYLKPGSRADGIRTGELIQVINQGVEALRAYYGEYLPQLALAVLVPLTVLVFILPVDTLTGLILLVTAPLIPLFMVLIGDRSKALTKRQWTTLSRMSAYFLDVIQGLGTLKIFGRSKDQICVITQIGERYRSTTMGVLRVTFLSALALEWLAMLSTAVVAVEIGLRLLYGRFTFEQGFFVLLLAPEFYLPLRLLGTRFHAGMAGVAAAGKIFEILETQPKQNVISFQDSQYLRDPMQGNREPLSIDFKDVHFGYGQDGEVLKGISLKIPAGKMTALVGPSGAGKSTLVDLLLGFIEAQDGQILISQRPIQSMRGSDWISQIAWVPQSPYLFNTSVAENIRFACKDASHDQVITAAINAYAHEFILQLPEGYNTLIGERGARLSAGQTQRLALARAYLKNAPLLIMDEAAANLDPDSVHNIQKALLNVISNRTALVIAHNLNTIQHADQIIVIAHGKVVETGNHHQLMDLDGLYTRMVRGEEPIAPLQPDTVQEYRPPVHMDLMPERQPIAEVAEDFSLASLKSLLSMLAEYKWQVLLSVILGWATVLSGVGLLATSAYLISAAALQPSIAVLQIPIVAVRTFGIARGLFRYLERYVSHETTFRLINRIRIWFYQVLEPLAPARLMQYQSGDLLNRIRQDMSTLEVFYVRVVAPPLVWVLVTAAVTVMLAFFSVQLGLVLLVFQILAGFITPILVRYVSRDPERKLVHQQADLSAALVDGIQGMAEIKVFDVYKTHRNRIIGLNQTIAAVQSQLSVISSAVGALENTLAHLASWLILLLAIPLVSKGQIEAVYLGTLILAALASFEAAQPLPQAAQMLERGLAAAGRLNEIVKIQPAVKDPVSPIPAPASHQLELVGINFTYPPLDQTQTGKPVLKGISCDLPPGKHLAIVGPSGAGKTSLVNLLLRFWDYNQGQIQLDHIELRDYNQDDVREQLAVLSQPIFLFNGTLGDNLRLGKPTASQDEISAACAQAQILDFIAALPRGFDTWIGEGGARLSAGERQRIAIARALLKNAPILILDEPTAHLDPLTESALVHSILNHAPDRTLLWITHRLVGMQAMDEILVMDDGQIVERGGHHQLLELGGMYRRMWDLQHQVL
ncbi:MAG TPA: thiol reductant ABC exporter subunit CydD [Anaerolineales bacterium]|nr:thiol reductant ABC exporter subunit CydD [Anaerolineales bacterium]